MKNDTWLELEKQFDEFPISKAESVPLDEINNASLLLSIPFPQDYIDFIERYGGAIVGPLSWGGENVPVAGG
ncbi:MAG: hypothetical protein JW725_05230 [Candidatus Babeliaceae bacterium]|nr:hypothetical protein [Candidatus Babeliaceae bacterium]